MMAAEHGSKVEINEKISVDDGGSRRDEAHQKKNIQQPIAQNKTRNKKKHTISVVEHSSQ